MAYGPALLPGTLPECAAAAAAGCHAVCRLGLGGSRLSLAHPLALPTTGLPPAAPPPHHSSATNRPSATPRIPTPLPSPQARQIRAWGAEGVICGSALVRALGESGSKEEGLRRMADLARSLREVI